MAAFQGSYNKKKEKLYTVYRPNTGLQPRQETLDEIKKKYKKVVAHNSSTELFRSLVRWLDLMSG